MDVPGLDALIDLLAGGRVAVLSGAGLSTESGIPDYRGPSGRSRPATPMTFQTFTRDPAARRRYWARSHRGWRAVAEALPNAGHRAVAQLERAGLLAGTVTQNVDGLHQAGGARNVVELHGGLDRVVCLDCGDRTSRVELDRRMRLANPGLERAAAPLKPDGDVDLDESEIEAFRTVDCEACGSGMLKPDVVFFGETVPADRVQRSYALVETASALLVLGSSLTVMSGHRFVLHAVKRSTPVAIVNQGPTRGDRYAAVAVDAPLGLVLPAVVERLGVAGRSGATVPA